MQYKFPGDTQQGDCELRKIGKEEIAMLLPRRERKGELLPRTRNQLTRRLCVGILAQIGKAVPGHPGPPPRVPAQPSAKKKPAYNTLRILWMNKIGMLYWKCLKCKAPFYAIFHFWSIKIIAPPLPTGGLGLADKKNSRRVYIWVRLGYLG
jgi:hypothetical protein